MKTLMTHNPRKSTIRWMVVERLLGIEEMTRRQIEEETEFDGTMCEIMQCAVGDYLVVVDDYDRPQTSPTWRCSDGDRTVYLSEDAMELLLIAYEEGHRHGVSMQRMEKPDLLTEEMPKLIGDDNPHPFQVSAFRTGIHVGWAAR